MTDRISEKERCIHLIGTPLLETSYDDFAATCHRFAANGKAYAAEFSNTHIVTSRRHEPAFRETTGSVDFFVPDGMPLIWCMNRKGARLSDRIYGPTFMRRCVLSSPAPWRHYFLGGWDETNLKLRENLLAQNPDILIVGFRSGRFTNEDYEDILREINEVRPHFIWVGLGTPKQQQWIHDYKPRIASGILLGVGFAFDVIAGTKKDAPAWMQAYGLTWLFRLLSEPARLGPRYFKYNLLFLYYLIRDELFGNKALIAKSQTSLNPHK